MKGSARICPSFGRSKRDIRLRRFCAVGLNRAPEQEVPLPKGLAEKFCGWIKIPNMTTTQAQQLSSGDEVTRGYHIGIVMRTTPGSVSVFWEHQSSFLTLEGQVQWTMLVAEPNHIPTTLV
jgi:hypothetical protein